MSILRNIIAALTGRSSADARTTALDQGSGIPAVQQKNQDGKLVDLQAVGATGYLLVYFYPKADTPGCTKQGCSLRDAFADLTAHKLTVIGVSTDPPEAQKEFQQKFNLPFDLLADEDASVIQAFGVPKLMGHAKRQAFLFENGSLIWRDLSASTAEQADDILKVIKG